MNEDSGLLIQFLLALAVVLILIAALAWILKKVNTVSARIGRHGEEPRLSISEALAVDHKRRLVLVKRDHVEHLVLIGGENDLLLEHAIPTRPPVTQPLQPPAGHQQKIPPQNQPKQPQKSIGQAPKATAEPASQREVKQPIPDAATASASASSASATGSNTIAQANVSESQTPPNPYDIIQQAQIAQAKGDGEAFEQAAKEGKKSGLSAPMVATMSGLFARGGKTDRRGETNQNPASVAPKVDTAPQQQTGANGIVTPEAASTTLDHRQKAQSRKGPNIPYQAAPTERASTEKSSDQAAQSEAVQTQPVPEQAEQAFASQPPSPAQDEANKQTTSPKASPSSSPDTFENEIEKLLEELSSGGKS